MVPIQICLLKAMINIGDIDLFILQTKKPLLFKVLTYLTCDYAKMCGY